MAAVGLGCGVMLHTMLAGIDVSALLRSSYLAKNAYPVIGYDDSKKKNCSTQGELIENIVGASAVTTYANSLCDFFHGLFVTGVSALFGLFKISKDFHPYMEAITES